MSFFGPRLLFGAIFRSPLWTILVPPFPLLLALYKFRASWQITDFLIFASFEEKRIRAVGIRTTRQPVSVVPDRYRKQKTEM